MQEIYPIGQRRACYACLQWDGTRTYDHDHAKIKVDAGSLGTCRITHSKIKGSGCCDSFYPLR